MLVEHLQVRLREHHGHGGERDRPCRGGHDQWTREGRPAPSEPHHGGCGENESQAVRKRQAQREPEAQLPGGHDPTSHNQTRRRPPVAANEQEERERDATAREHVEVR